MKHLMTKTILVLGASGMMLLAQNPPPASTDPQATQGTRASNDSQMATKVHQAIMDDQTLGTAAHSVKVTAKNGTVTLHGKVATEQEKDAIETKAKQVAGDSNVKDEITVSKPK